MNFAMSWSEGISHLSLVGGQGRKQGVRGRAPLVAPDKHQTAVCGIITPRAWVAGTFWCWKSLKEKIDRRPGKQVWNQKCQQQPFLENGEHPRPALCRGLDSVAWKKISSPTCSSLCSRSYLPQPWLCLHAFSVWTQVIRMRTAGPWRYSAHWKLPS